MTKPNIVEKATNIALELETVEKYQILDLAMKLFPKRKDFVTSKKPLKQGGPKFFKRYNTFLGQSTTQDKGKGKVGERLQGQGKPPVKCYECGGPHFK